MIYLEGSFEGIMAELHHKLLEAPPVDTGHWQGLKNVPHTATRELQRVTFEMNLPPTMGEAQWLIEPNLPWAEDHFQERVAGVPINPGNQYMNWPWYRGGVEDHKELGYFSHTYMERYWPKTAGQGRTNYHNRGIRYKLGDLDDLCSLLLREPHTRQAYLPIWFPEDGYAASALEERVPCSLGYHFMLRDGRLNVSYFMRSLDFLRYMRDDVYLTMRLAQWVLDSLVPREANDERDYDADSPWAQVQPGVLLVHASSLHVFEGDRGKMVREAPLRP